MKTDLFITDTVSLMSSFLGLRFPTVNLQLLLFPSYYYFKMLNFSTEDTKNIYAEETASTS